MHLGYGSLSITTSESLLTKELDVDVQSVLQGQVSLAAVNQIYVIHSAMDGSKVSSKTYFENVNIYRCAVKCHINNILIN